MLLLQMVLCQIPVLCFFWGRGFVEEGVLCETVFISSVNERSGECVETFVKEIICFNTLLEKFPQFPWGMLKEFFMISVRFSDIGQEIQFILLIMVIKNSEVTRPFIRIKKKKNTSDKEGLKWNATRIYWTSDKHAIKFLMCLHLWKCMSMIHDWLVNRILSESLVVWCRQTRLFQFGRLAGIVSLKFLWFQTEKLIGYTKTFISLKPVKSLRPLNRSSFSGASRADVTLLSQ